MNRTIPQIAVEDLAARLERPDPSLQLIDVREREEAAIAYLQGFEVLPLSEFEEWSPHIATRFDPEKETLVLCHHGVRSTRMCHWLLNVGFTNVKNVSGGIDAYSLRVDAGVPRY